MLSLHQKKYFCGVLWLCSFFVHIFSAHALTAKNNLAVSVVVPAKVQLSATPLDFGIVSTTRNIIPSATASIIVNMVATQVYRITLSAGLHKLTSRRMQSPAGTLVAYDLYKNSTYTTPWGDAGYDNTFATGNALTATGTGSNQTFTVYGRLQSVPTQTGNFTDTITVTVHY